MDELGPCGNILPSKADDALSQMGRNRMMWDDVR